MDVSKGRPSSMQGRSITAHISTITSVAEGIRRRTTTGRNTTRRRSVEEGFLALASALAGKDAPRAEARVDSRHCDLLPALSWEVARSSCVFLCPSPCGAEGRRFSLQREV